MAFLFIKIGGVQVMELYWDYFNGYYYKDKNEISKDEVIEFLKRQIKEKIDK